MKIQLRQGLVIGLIIVFALLLMGAGRYRQMQAESLTPAAQHGDTAAIRSALRWRPDPNTPDRSGEAPLPAAVKYRHFDTAEVLLQAGADPNGKIFRGSGDSLLTEAIAQGQFAFARDLIAHGAKIDPPQGESPLAAAIDALAAHAENGQAQQMVDTLLSHGASVNPGAGTAPLVVAAAAGRPDLIQMLVGCGAQWNIDQDGGNSALLAAARGGSGAVWNQLWKLGARPDGQNAEWARAWAKNCLDPDWVRRLQAAHIDVNAGGNAGQNSRTQTALMLSLADARRVRALLALGASPEMKTAGGNTTLILAAQKSGPEAIGLLLSRGARVDERGFNGMTALLEAAEQNRPEIVATLLAAGASPNAADNQGVTALAQAAQNGDLRSAGLLLGRGANPNATEHTHGWTPLMIAVQSGRYTLIPLLLSHGANVHAKDAAGETALFLAARRPDTAPAEALLHAGADANAADKRGTTPLQEATRLHHSRVAGLLQKSGAH